MRLVANDTIAVLDWEMDRGVSRVIEQDGDLSAHDPRIREIFCPLIPVGGVVVDGGAFIGDHTVPYAEAVGPTGQVWAFEVSPASLECLRFNTRHFQQVQVVTAALADVRCQVTITLGLPNAGCDAIDQVRPDGLPAIPLDLLTFDRLDYVKLDLEGYELRALRGAEQQLRRHRPIVVCETGRQLARYGDTHEVLMRFMTGLGYTSERLPYEHPYHEVFDVLFRPKEA